MSSTSSSWKTLNEENSKDNSVSTSTNNINDKDCFNGCFNSKTTWQEHITDAAFHDDHVNSKLTNILSAIMPRKSFHEINRENQCENDSNFEGKLGYPLHGSGGICNWPGCENVTNNFQLFIK